MNLQHVCSNSRSWKVSLGKWETFCFFCSIPHNAGINLCSDKILLSWGGINYKDINSGWKWANALMEVIELAKMTLARIRFSMAHTVQKSYCVFPVLYPEAQRSLVWLKWSLVNKLRYCLYHVFQSRQWFLHHSALIRHVISNLVWLLRKWGGELVDNTYRFNIRFSLSYRSWETAHAQKTDVILIWRSIKLPCFFWFYSSIDGICKSLFKNSILPVLGFQ